MDGTAVDWILRDLRRVCEQWARAQCGEFAFHAQAGHPLGFLDVAYAGELARGRILADLSGRLAALQEQCRRYPEPLRRSLIDAMWEADFLLDGAAKAAPRGDVTYVALCLSRALLLAAHAIHAHARVWPTNEKGLIPAAAGLPGAPADFAIRANAVLGHLGTEPADLLDAIAAVRELLSETRYVRRHD